MSYEVETKTTKVHHLYLDSIKLIDLINGATLRDSCRNVINIPQDATVEFMVPGGGDYSNCSVDVDEDAPIHIYWTQTE